MLVLKQVIKVLNQRFNRSVKSIIDEVVSATKQFKVLAEDYKLPSKVIAKIESEFVLV